MLKISIPSLVILVRFLLLVALLIYFWKCVIAYMYMQVVLFAGWYRYYHI